MREVYRSRCDCCDGMGMGKRERLGKGPGRMEDIFLVYDEWITANQYCEKFGVKYPTLMSRRRRGLCLRGSLPRRGTSRKRKGYTPVAIARKAGTQWAELIEEFSPTLRAFNQWQRIMVCPSVPDIG